MIRINISSWIDTDLTNRPTVKLDFLPHIEQAGFTKGFKTIDHLTIRVLIEKCTKTISLHRFI